jgi:hypothetical protein
MDIVPVETEFDADEITERVGVHDVVVPHVRLGPGQFALCTYLPAHAGQEPRTEVVRPGEIVPETLLGGYYQFSHGVMFELR